MATLEAVLKDKYADLLAKLVRSGLERNEVALDVLPGITPEIQEKMGFTLAERVRLNTVTLNISAANQSAPPPPQAAPDISSELLTLLCPKLDMLAATAEDAVSYLNSTGGMRVPVGPATYLRLTTSYPNVASLLTIIDAVYVESSLLALRTNHFMRRPYVEHGTEQSTALTADVMTKDLLEAFDRSSEGSINLLLGFNKAEASTSSATLRKRKRPDMHAGAKGCTLFFAEAKVFGNLAAAVEDLKSKLVGLNVMHYGKVPYLLAYAAAGALVQFYVVTVNDNKVNLHEAGEELNLAEAAGIAKMIMMLARVYRLLQRMVASLPPRHGRHALFSTIERGEGTTLCFAANSLIKCIKHFSAFAERHQTDINVLTAAYKAAQQSAEARCRAGLQPVLSVPQSLPTVSRNDGYKVTVGPLGAHVLPTSEAELRTFARACCGAAAVLHKKDIVHRDFRSENIVQLLPSGEWMVIDLELATLAGKEVPDGYKLAGWDDAVLDVVEGRCVYTKSSDMRVMGLMLDSIVRKQALQVSDLAAGFITQLQGKLLSAEAALQHAWLLGE